MTFSVEIIVEQDKLIFHPQAAAPLFFEFKQIYHPSFVKKYAIILIDTQKIPQVILSSIVHTLDFLTHVHYKSNHNTN